MKRNSGQQSMNSVVISPAKLMFLMLCLAGYFSSVYFSSVSGVLMGLVPAANAQEAVAEGPIYTGLFSNKAVSGYDTVAYFKAGRPVKGDKRFSTSYAGAMWFFSSQENLNDFKASPGKYAPQYGGYCAYAAAKNDLVSSDPEAWKIVDGKLFLNYSADIQKKWEADQSRYIQLADGNWPALSQK